MPLELAVWRIDGELRAVAASGPDLEERLETLLDQDVTNAAVQRQVASGGTPSSDSKSGLAFRNRVLRGLAPF